MKRFVVLLAVAALWVATPPPVLGQSVKLPAEVRGEPREWVIVSAEVDGTSLQWYLPDGGLEEVALGPLLGEEAAGKMKGKVFKAARPGRYRVMAYCAKAGKASPPAVCVVIIGDAPPLPPPIPPPSDPLVVAFQAAYASDTDPAKATKVGPLAELLEGVVKAARDSGSIQTLGQLQAKAHEAVDLVAGKGGLSVLRKAASNHIATKFPKEDGPMTEALWATAASAYAETAKALRGVKP